MPAADLTGYRYRGARALVLLHDRGMREFPPAWRQAVEAGIKLPVTADPDYASLPALLFHVLRASRGYLTWLCEKLGLPDPRVDDPPGLDRVGRDVDLYLSHLLERWRGPLADVEEKRFSENYTSRWGENMSCEAMLEHAVVHPLRHRFQLEELMEAQLHP